MILTVAFESKSPVGSSSKMIAGEFARDLAIALNKNDFTLFVVHHLIVNLANDQLFQKDQLF